ncbi:hypothetical protein GACE_1972 [Geoglobus acetivorans]|uniref:HEPN domain-containing protein n=1 Tax=Geoglobus acetivorans TaxID=565033 RepID=A0A0A7GJ63_GEOAI|nr:hypothetical protein GACE_1972 [Geoglobus acetivorans]
MEKAKIWLERAKADLKSAEVLIEVVPADSVYHSQQAVEKAIKAALSVKGIEVKEHRVSGLFYDEFVVLFPELEEIYGIAVELEKHWLKSRYPIDYSRGVWDPLRAYSPKDAESFFEMAKTFVLTLEEFLVREFGLKVNMKGEF